MDVIDFINNTDDRLEMTEKAGLYCVMQSNIPKHLQAHRCGLAGKPVDSATKFKSGEGSFKSRFAQYLNYWRPEGNAAKVFAVLTVKRMLAGRQADAAPPPSGSCPVARRLLGRLLPGSGRQPPGRSAAAAAAAGQHPLDRTTPKHKPENARICRHSNILRRSLQP